MSNNNLFRYGGIAAIASAVLFIVSMGLSIAGSTTLGTQIYWASSILFLGALAVLTMTLQRVSQPLAILALVMLGGTTIWSLFIDPTQPNDIFGPLALIYGAGFVLYGWLQYRSAEYTNTLSYLAFATGGLSMVGGIALLAGGSIDIFGVLNLILSVPFVIWLVQMGRRWMAGAGATATFGR
jgi:hypothetical protein